MKSNYITFFTIIIAALIFASCSNQAPADSIESLEAKLKEVTSGNGIDHEAGQRCNGTASCCL